MFKSTLKVQYFKNTCEMVDILVLWMVCFTIFFLDHTTLSVFRKAMLSDVYFHFI